MTTDILTFSLSVFTGFFAIMNPIANTPVFLGLVGDRNEQERKSIERTLQEIKNRKMSVQNEPSSPSKGEH